ncbi:MAG: ABC transporter ATP-binding protein [Deltaproteobacteria bacterium]|nr:ABC transporter ATP-binding protein [Deltaproteobacteria bacterium]MBW2126005.1 ABC transporter ATP-binding protein [Deltaproteobacteria bacterium]
MVARIEGLSKYFFIRHNRSYFLKERAIALLKGNFREKKEMFWALRNVNLEVNRGEFLGLIGPNGSGKSTLLKLMAGILSPSKGKIIIKGRVAPIIELGVGFEPDLTGTENIYLSASLYGLTKKEIQMNYDDIVRFSGLEDFIDVPIKNYSTGMQMRLAFSISLSIDPDIFLIDEILAVGDEKFQAKCFEKMEEIKKKKTIVFVSHDMHAVKMMCDRVCLLVKGKILDEGPPEKVIDSYHKVMAVEE